MATFAPKIDARDHAFLREHGWSVSGMNEHNGRLEWRHPRLNWPWTTATACQLQAETNGGKREHVHRMLRGED